MLKRLVPLIVLGVTACSSAPLPEGSASTSLPTINGKASDNTQDAVVLILYDAGGGNTYGCTGTLLAPNLVVTARHCVSQTAETGIACNADGTPIAGGQVS